MRLRVAGVTLLGLSKYLESVGRETPQDRAKSSMVLIVILSIGNSGALRQGKSASADVAKAVSGEKGFLNDACSLTISHAQNFLLHKAQIAG